MKFYHYSSIKKATLALLDLFNNISINYNGADKIIPIKFRSKERALLLDEFSTKQLLSGNTSVLPLLSLSFVGITRNLERKTNKYIHKMENDNIFTYNSIPVDINFELNFLCRTMTELSMFIEQIYPMFNPTYPLKILEFKNTNIEDIQLEPTVIPIHIDDPQIEINDDYSENEIRLITCSIPLIYRGNLYPEHKVKKKFKKLIVYLSKVDSDDTYEKVYKFEKDLLKDELSEIDLRPGLSVNDSLAKPVINDIIFNRDGNKLNFKIDFYDLDNEGSELKILIGTTDGIIHRKNNFSSGYIDITDVFGTISVSAQIIDYHGNTSNLLVKQVNI